MKLVYICILSCACVAPMTGDSPTQTSAEQAEWDGSDWDPEGETVVVEGGLDVCWDAGLCWPGVGPEPPTDPIGPTGGGGGGGGGGPKKPQRKDCTEEEDYEACVQCCWYNYNDVDGYDCRKISDPIAREACWQSIFPAYVACLLYCKRRDPGILTISLPDGEP